MKGITRMKKNPHAVRLDSIIQFAKDGKFDALMISNPANIQALTNLVCDNATLLIRVGARQKVAVKFYTDFRYIPMVHRLAPWLQVEDIRKIKFNADRIGCEYSMPYAKMEELSAEHPKAEFIDITKALYRTRAIKSPYEIDLIRKAEQLNCEIFVAAQQQFVTGMTERDLARLIKHLMIDRGEGEAFETIVCVGKNAAECHHIPDDTTWTGKEAVLVDMGVRLNGYCSDLTRNILPRRPSAFYREIYKLVLQANRAAIAAAQPGMTCGELDAVARGIIEKAGYGKAFGHSLGHGVGVEIHELPTARKKDDTILAPGMVVTIEPGIYLEGKLGVRIEDMILITQDGCECLSEMAEKNI